MGMVEIVPKCVTLVPKKVVTADGDSTSEKIEVPIGYDSGVFMINIYAVSGTSPTLDVYILTEDFYSGNWFQIAQYLSITTTGQYPIIITKGLGKYLAVSWKVGGTTPSFTLSISAVLKR